MRASVTEPHERTGPPGRLTQVRARCGIAFSVIIFQTDDPFLLKLQTQRGTVVPHVVVACIENLEDM